MAENSIDPDPFTFEVIRSDRRFPMLPEALHSPPHNRIRELQVQSTEESLPERLSQAISQRLPWQATVTHAAPDREAVVSAYVNSLKQLAVYRNDVEMLVLEAWRANLEFRQSAGETHEEAREAVLSGKLEETMAQAFLDWMPAKNIVTAALLSQPHEDYTAQLSSSLSDEVTHFSRQLFEMMQRMVDLELFGLVEWLPKQCCRYHFFRRVVIQGATELHEAVTETLPDDEDPDVDRHVGRRVIGHRRTTSTQSIKHEIRFARHQHELINAVRTSIRNSTVVMPPQIVRLIESIPEWLYPFVEVIDGQIVRELIIERDVSIEDWTQVDVRDEPIIDVDPGIVIGPFVLSGWGSVEIRKEQERRQEVEDARTHRINKRLAPVLTAAAIGLSGIALWLQYRSSRGNGSGVLVALTTVTAVAAAWQTFLAHAALNHFAAPRHYAHCMAISTAMVLISAEWVVARIFNPMFWVTPVALLTIGYLGFRLGRLFR